jgi:hypothetical protein
MTAVGIETREPGVYEVRHPLTGEVTDWEVVPWSMGPTWDRNPDWDGPRDPQGYILPKLTLGYQVIKWIQDNLLDDESDDENEIPFKLTPEQARFILWFYALDEGDEYREATGRFKYREVVLQRLKGWGKDPLAAVIAAVEFVGPCRFGGWAAVDMPEHGITRGEPYAKPHPRAWIQIAAVSLEQTQNTMKMFQGIFSKACMAEHSIDPGKEKIYAYQGKKTIQAVTSSPRALEGNRPTLVIKNETHHWLGNNDGHDMADAIERNATKAKGGAARTLSITNAYEPSEESVARAEREAYELEAAGLTPSTGMMYDTLEAPPDARLRPRFEDESKDYEGPEISMEEKERRTRLYLRRVLEAVAGGAWWLEIENLTNSILNRKHRPSRSRRFWFNQVVASEDAWLDPVAVDRAIYPLAKEQRLEAERDARSVLEAGWLVAANEPIVMFFDGSKSDDSSALVGCRLRDGYVFTIGVWQKPPGKRGETWLAPRGAITNRVNEAFELFNVVAFWGDPSHAKDDEDSSRYWDGTFDLWLQTHREKLDTRYWPLKSGHRKHGIMFDMAGPDQQKLFVAAAEEFVEGIENLNDIEEYEPLFFHDGHPALMEHMKNAVRNPGQWGISLMKENRESSKKIDLAVCAVGARMLRRVVMNTGLEEEEEEEQPGTIWGVGF